MIDVLIAFGTRPEFLKLAPVVMQLSSNPKFRVTTLFSGQHSRSVLGSDLFFDDMPFDIELDVMRPGQPLAELSARILKDVSVEIAELKPDICVVHGDTTTALSTAMAAFYQGVRVAHVEAGLRTRNLAAPFPEELNRQVIARLATWNFAPTLASKQNLLNEAVDPASIVVTGNTIVDTLQQISRRIEEDEDLASKISEAVFRISPRLLEAEKLILVTAHRRENHAVGIKEICLGIARFAQQNPDSTILFAMHPNPIVQRIVVETLADIESVILTGPLGYGEFVYLLNRCSAVVTDSGGIQEEAVSLGKVVLVTRESTERAEGVSSGLLRVVGADSVKIFESLNHLERNRTLSLGGSGTASPNPYGDGKASERIVRVLCGGPTEEFVEPIGTRGQGVK